MQALMVVPPHVSQRRELDLFDGAPRPSAIDQLGLVAGVHAFGEHVVVGDPAVPTDGVTPNSTSLSV